MAKRRDPHTQSLFIDIYFQLFLFGFERKKFGIVRCAAKQRFEHLTLTHTHTHTAPTTH